MHRKANHYSKTVFTFLEGNRDHSVSSSTIRQPVTRKTGHRTKSNLKTGLQPLTCNNQKPCDQLNDLLPIECHVILSTNSWRHASKHNRVVTAACWNPMRMSHYSHHFPCFSLYSKHLPCAFPSRKSKVTPVNAMKTYNGNRCFASLIFNISTRRRWSKSRPCSFTRAE
jgi:hypothetical protein